MIITEKAREQIKNIAEAEGIGHTSVRVKIVGSGCAGFAFDMEYDNAPSDLDEVEVIGDITVVIDPLSFQYIAGVEMDYAETTYGAGFKFSKGEIKSVCGCGNSVSFEEEKKEE